MKGTASRFCFSDWCANERKAAECVSDHGKHACEDIGGECVTERDGFYIVSAVCLGLGIISVIFHMLPTARKLQGMWFLVLTSRRGQLMT